MGKSVHLQLPRSKDEVEAMLQKKRVASLAMERSGIGSDQHFARLSLCSLCPCQCTKVLLRLQPPDLNLQTLDLGTSRVLCAAASPERGDGTGGHAQSPRCKDPL